MPKEPESKPCVICNKMLRPVGDDWDTMQPYGGGEMRLIFAYGSEKLDLNMTPTVYSFVICDDCGLEIINEDTKRAIGLPK